MLRALVLLSLLVTPVVFADAVTLTMEDWARPRSGEALTELPALTDVLQEFDAADTRVIAIGHATSEAGQLWAAELRSWLVALGVSSGRVRLEARPELQGVLILDVRKESRP
jgi:hypothetical protein